MKLLQNLFNLQKNESNLIMRLSTIFVVMFFLYLIANYFLVRTLSIKDVKSELQKSASTITDELDFTDGHWNTKKYLSDITIPSGLSIYIYSLDGFMIDRTNPVNGFLDTSNFEFASSFRVPKTVSYISNETWRLYSYEVVRDEQTKGVIFLAYFEPRGISESELDTILSSNAQLIDQNIQMKGNGLDVSGVRQNEIDPNISFEVIDQYNKLYITNGGPPAYIDKSYIQSVLAEKALITVTDSMTSEKFLVHINPIRSQEKIVGVVVIGKGLGSLNNILKNQIILSFGAGILAVITFAIGSQLLYKRDLASIIQQKILLANKPTIITVEKMRFDKSSSIIMVNGKTHIEIPKDSYQWDICSNLFKKPTKRFYNDELSEIIGEQDEQKNTKRLIYDAVDAINEKVMKTIGQKLITHQDTQYFILPDLASKVA